MALVANFYTAKYWNRHFVVVINDLEPNPKDVYLKLASQREATRSSWKVAKTKTHNQKII